MEFKRRLTYSYQIWSAITDAEATQDLTKESQIRQQTRRLAPR